MLYKLKNSLSNSFRQFSSYEIINKLDSIKNRTLT